ncbi:efflux RND transporter periplasmic adaptor subunit [Thermodesulfobacteriota bacterium]
MKEITPLVLFLALIVFTSSCSDPEAKTAVKSKKIPVEILHVKKQPVLKSLRLLGTVKADREMSLSFKIGGKIKDIHFRRGDLIKEGSLLAELEITGFLAQKQKVWELQKKAKRDLDRLERLFNEKSAPLSSLQDARSQYNSIRADIKIIEDNIINSFIRAPFTGRIDRKLHEPGEVVAMGNPVAVLTDMDPIIVKAAVPDNMIREIRNARKAVIRVDSYPERDFKGVVTRLDITADPVSRTFGMEVLLSNPGEMLRPGLIAKVEIPYGTKEPRIFIPMDTVIGFGSSPSVFIVKDLKAVRRVIRTGEIIEEIVEVLEGLEPGEMLVISGQEYLSDGKEVFIGK